MARPGISDEQKLTEGRLVQSRFEDLQREEPDLTVDSFAHEIGVSQGLISQYFTGRTAIPDKRLMWLGGRLRFDPFELRPNLREYMFSGLTKSGRNKAVSEILKYLLECDDGEFSRVTAIIFAYLSGGQPVHKR